MSARKDPIPRLYQLYKQADENYVTAYDALDRAEVEARKAGINVSELVTVAVGKYVCDNVPAIRSCGKELGYSQDRIAKLIGQFREREREMRERRRAAGLAPFVRKKNAAYREWRRALAAVAKARATSLEGLVIKLGFISRDARLGPSPEAKNMARSALADAIRLARRSKR